MRTHIIGATSFAALTLCIACFVACSDPPSLGRGEMKVIPEPAPKPTRKDAGALTPDRGERDAGAPGPAPGAGAACKAKPGTQCLDCCDAAFAAKQDFWMDVLTACECAPTACKSACATTVCSATPVDSVESGTACSDCLLEKSAACEKKADEACEADAQCGGRMACMNACPIGDDDDATSTSSSSGGGPGDEPGLGSNEGGDQSSSQDP